MKHSAPVRSLLLISILACSLAVTTLLATTQNSPKSTVTDASAPPPPPTQAPPPNGGNPPPPPPPPGGWHENQDGPQGQGEGRGPGGGPGGPGGAGMVPNVGRSMNGMNRAITKLASQLSDASKKEENLMLIGEAERSCVGAKMAPVPGKILDNAKDEAGKDKIKAEFRAHLINALKMMIETEESIVADKPDAAKATLDKLVKYRDETHTLLGVGGDDNQ